MLHVKMLSVILIPLFISGCGEAPQPTIVYIPQKCKVPFIEPPIIDNEKYISYNEIIAKALNNYVAMKEYAEKLLASQEVCK